jgi:DNA invertase Pin-like site-specific DNA recombinase
MESGTESNCGGNEFFNTLLAEFERELIKARIGEGRLRAKARGVHMGRPPALTPHQRREALARREAGEALTDRYRPNLRG